MPKAPEPRTSRDSIWLDGGVTWTTALNATAECQDVSITLLALDVVDGLMRMSALLRVGDRPEMRVATIPTLEVALPDGTPLPMVDARVVPQGRVSWMSWTYERPLSVPVGLEGRIANVVLEYHGGRSPRIDIPGPWDFSVLVRPPELLEAARLAASAGGER